MRSLKKSIRRVSRWAVAVALLPVLWSLSHQLANMAPSVAREGLRSLWPYLAGAAGYLAFERLISRPMSLYVFGHELTHAVSGILSGAKIHSFKSTAKGGEVHLSKSNAFIALSPYVVPLYAVIAIVIYALTRLWWNPPALAPAFQVILGGTMAFHLSLTYSALHSRQTDLKIMGFLLSGVVIAMGNVLILALLAVSLFQKTPTLREFGLETMRETSTIYLRGLRQVAVEFNRLNAPPTSGLTTTKERTKWTR